MVQSLELESKWKRLLLSRKVELICINYIWIARKLLFRSLPTLLLSKLMPSFAIGIMLWSPMESLHFNQKCAYVVAGSSHLLPYLHWALSNQHLYWPWEAVTIAKWKACVSGFGNKTHIALLASAIKYNITVYVRSWGCQYKHLGWPLLLGPCPMHKLYSLPRTILSLPCLIGDWGFSEPIFWHGDAWSMFVKYWQVWCQNFCFVVVVVVCLKQALK